MRSNPTHYDMVAPTSLSEALRMLSEEPGVHLPLAGGTELMVAFAAGRLTARKLLSLHHLYDLRFLEAATDHVRVGAATTFTDLRRSAAIQQHFPLLAQAASWTGSIANQNRGTLGGNIVNASPAADSPPALLVYEAQVCLVSVRGERTLPYRDFHLGYKNTALAPDELVHSILLPHLEGSWQGYIRKVGTRNAQAISKVALAGLALIHDKAIKDIRIAAASLREIPTRCAATEHALRGQPLAPHSISVGCEALATEVRPIDDIRSTAPYRTAVARNLLDEFLSSLR